MLKPFTRLACPETRTNVLDIEEGEGEREAKPRGESNNNSPSSASFSAQPPTSIQSLKDGNGERKEEATNQGTKKPSDDKAANLGWQRRG